MFRNEADYAYFAARLGWTPEQYGSLTPVELAFVRKELETRTVRESELLQQAVEVAVANVMRKKGRKAAQLWKRRRERGASRPSRRRSSTPSRRRSRGWVAGPAHHNRI